MKHGKLKWRDDWVFIFPLAIILFYSVGQWKYAQPIDGPHPNLFWGFPLSHSGQAYHTSMGYQFFILEFFIDFIFYFILTGCLFLITKDYLNKIIYKKTITKILWTLAGLLIIAQIFFLFFSNTIFKLYRDFDWIIKDSGLELFLIKL